MTLLFTMLPFYVLGNLHCLGMCGPLVMMIGKHRFRYFYFAGRLVSFTLAGVIAGEAGTVLQVILNYYHLSVLTSFVFGALILFFSLFTLLNWRYPGYDFLARRLAGVNQNLSILMLKDQPWPSFLFGFFTIALPCGQTMIVFSAIALSGNIWTGFLNGFVFALLTTPSLFAAMHAHQLFFRLKKHYNAIIGVFGLLIGILAICRGLADVEVIPHLILNHKYHVVIY